MVGWLRSVPHLVVRRTPGTSFAYLALNLRDPRLARRRVREAIALAIDRDAFIEFVHGAARPATGLLAPGHWAYAPTRPRRHDPARARRLLDRAGLPDPDGPGPRPRFRLVYKTSNQIGRRRLAEAICRGSPRPRRSTPRCASACARSATSTSPNADWMKWLASIALR